MKKTNIEVVEKIAKDLDTNINKGIALDHRVHVSLIKVNDEKSKGMQSGICGYGNTYEEACNDYLKLLCAAKNPVFGHGLRINTDGLMPDISFKKVALTMKDIIDDTAPLTDKEQAINELKDLLEIGVDIKYVGNRVDGRFFNSSHKVNITRRLECTKDGRIYTIIGSSPNRPVRKIFLELAINGVLQGPGIGNNGLEFIIPEFEFCDSDDCLRIRGLLDRIKDEHAKVLLDELKDYLKRKILVTYTGSDEDFICGKEYPLFWDEKAGLYIEEGFIFGHIKMSNDEGDGDIVFINPSEENHLRRLLGLKELSEPCADIKIKYSGCCIGGVKISESASAKEYFLHWTDDGALFIYPENNDTPMKLKLDGYGGLCSLNKDFYVEFKFCNSSDEAKVFKILKDNYNKAKMSKIKYRETSVCMIPCWPIYSPLYNVPIRVYTRTGDFVNFYYKNPVFGDMTCLTTSISDIRDQEWVNLNGITYICKLEIKGFRNGLCNS